MKRRTFVTGTLANVLAPLAQAQRREIPRIALVHPTQFGSTVFQAFSAELDRQGLTEGKTVVLERYSAEGHSEWFPELAKEVVRRRPDVVLAATSSMVLSFKAATETIPIVGITEDPIARGITSSLARPGKNITGVVVDAGLEIWEKRLAIAKEAVPNAVRIGFLAPRRVAEGAQGNVMREAAHRLGVHLIEATLASPVNEVEYARVFSVLTQERADALVVSDAGENGSYQKAIVDLASKGSLPALYPFPYFAEAGGLMAYAVDIVDLFIRAAGQIVEILKGASVSEMPFYRASTFKLIINLKTAKVLGLTIAPSLLARADEVID